MCESRTPFLSLDKAGNTGPGKVCDLGTILARHSLSAWLTGYEGPSERSYESILVALEVSHDGEHWIELGQASLSMDEARYSREDASHWPPRHDSSQRSEPAWPARYVRARIKDWPKKGTGLVSATVASA